MPIGLEHRRIYRRRVRPPHLLLTRSVYDPSLWDVESNRRRLQLTAAVTVPSIVASGMTFSAGGFEIIGDATVAVTVAGAMVEGRTLAGAVSVPITVAATMAWNQHPQIAGAVTITTVVASGMVAAEGGNSYQIAGYLQVPVTIRCSKKLRKYPVKRIVPVRFLHLSRISKNARNTLIRRFPGL